VKKMRADALRNIPSTTGDLRRFGIVMGVVLAVIGGLLFYQENPAGMPLLGVGGAFLVAGLALPRVLVPLHKGWMLLAMILSWLMTRIVLSLLFFLVITPMSVVSRLLGKKYLDLSFRTDADTYWNHRPESPSGRERWERQY